MFTLVLNGTNIIKLIMTWIIHHQRSFKDIDLMLASSMLFFFIRRLNFYSIYILFQIFYPDLLDTNQTPTFTITPCDDPDFAILRFHAGPPYEDIAFKCVNREWEISHKHGYKCQFAKGIFQLWFFFKRYRYRR